MVVLAEVPIDLIGGVSVHAVDLFRVDDGRIRSRTYFIADEADGGGTPPG